MLLVAVVFLVLFFVLPGEIHLGAAVASLIIASVFHGLHRRATPRRWRRRGLGGAVPET